jgi:medium-chain acyl-[acyl-carrier-protein] hydrolase
MKKNERFTENHIIYGDSLNGDLTATYCQLMRIALETGSRHSASVGFDLDYFIKAQKGWAIMRWDAEFYSFPKWNETVAASTWPTLFKGFVAERAYGITALDGTPVMSAHSVWILMDLQKRKAARPDKEHVEKYLPIYPPALTADFNFADVNDGGHTLLSSRAHTIKRTDIDSNGHVNNLRYISWAFDSTEAERIKRLKVSYKKECTLGERVIIETYHKIETYRNNNNTDTVRIKNERGLSVAEIDILM